MANSRGGKARGGGRGSGHGRGKGKGKGEVANEEIDDGATGGLTASVEEDSASCRDRRTTGRPQAGPDHETGSIDEIAVTRPGRQTLPPPLNTRAANKNTHPGAIVAPATRRSSEVVQAERLRLEELRVAAENHQSTAISRVAPSYSTRPTPTGHTQATSDFNSTFLCTHDLTFFLEAPLASNNDLGMDGDVLEPSDSGSEYEGDKDADEFESEEEMETAGPRVAVSQARGKKSSKHGRDSVMAERSVGVVGKRKSQTDVHDSETTRKKTRPTHFAPTRPIAPTFTGLAPDWRTTAAAGTSTTSIGNRSSSFSHTGQRASTPVPQTSVTRSVRLRESRTVRERSSTPADAGSGDGATDSDGVVINFAAFADDPDTIERNAVGTPSTASKQAIEPLTWDMPAVPRAVSRPIEGGLQVPRPRGEDFMSMRTAQYQTRDALSSQRGGSSSHHAMQPPSSSTYSGGLPPEPSTGRLPSGSSRELGASVGPASAQVRDKAAASGQLRAASMIMPTRVTVPPELSVLPKPVIGPKRQSTPASVATRESTQRTRPRIEQLPVELQPYFHGRGAVAQFAKRITATLRPFMNLAPEDLQQILDILFPEADYVVTGEKCLMYQLILPRLRDWRNEIGAAGEAAADYYVGQLKHNLRELGNALTEEEETERIREYIELLLGNVNDRSRPFWWGTWKGENDKQGRFQSIPILYVFGVHLEACGISLSSPLEQLFRTHAPIGGLILSVYSVERGLAMYRKGRKEVPAGKMERWFSIENWDDGEQLDEAGNMINVRREAILTRYLNQFSLDEWLTIVRSALEFRSQFKKPRRARKGKERAQAAPVVADVVDDDDGSDWVLRSDPIEPHD